MTKYLHTKVDKNTALKIFKNILMSLKASVSIDEKLKLYLKENFNLYITDILDIFINNIKLDTVDKGFKISYNNQILNKCNLDSIIKLLNYGNLNLKGNLSISKYIDNAIICFNDRVGGV